MWFFCGSLSTYAWGGASKELPYVLLAPGDWGGNSLLPRTISINTPPPPPYTPAPQQAHEANCLEPLSVGWKDGLDGLCGGGAFNDRVAGCL